ncbi:flagellar protein [Paenibacillus aestuarii]|uniref:Flagellar protein n=1 Tax=Paenibacillus aestuarii TaxID=516965 RepID=A0ABW0K401_9BACL|nr:flagellar protein [Paenibacillus aestuarii]
MSLLQLNVDNCPRCGKVFQKNVRNQCNDCSREMDHKLNRVLDFMRKNYRSTNEQVAEATGVGAEQLMSWMRESKLLVADYPNLHYLCSSCKAPIRIHKLCTDCSIRIQQDIVQLKEKEQKNPAPIPREVLAGVSGGFQIRDRLSGSQGV